MMLRRGLGGKVRGRDLACLGVVAFVLACSSPGKKTIDGGARDGASDASDAREVGAAGGAGGGGGAAGAAGGGAASGGAGGRAGAGGLASAGDGGAATGSTGGGGGVLATGGTAGTAGQGGAPADAGADASDASASCGADGTSCAAGLDSPGVCCGGACVPGACCAASDCAKDDGGAGSVCVAHQCRAVANSLSGLLWLLPCTGSLSGTVCSTVASQKVSTQLASNVSGTFKVTLRFRGVVEQKTYQGGCAEGMWLSGGTYASGDSYNIYKLTVSSPAQTFYLNAGTSSIENTFLLDVTRTILMDAGATVTLEADAVDGQEIKNVAAGTGTPLTVDVSSPAQPYDGQFIKMDVVDIAASTVTSALPTAGGGGALKFAGGQYVTVPRSAGLEPRDVTVEAWTTFAGSTGSYNTVLGKPYGNSTADSYSIWYEGGALHAGTALSSPVGSVSLPWNPAPSEWHHLALTHDDTAQITKLFVDGVIVACTAATATPAYDEHAVYLGGDIDNGTLQGFWNGALDEVRIFEKARTAEQIWSDMHTHKLAVSEGLVAEWTFDEGTGQTVSDSSGHGATGTLGASSAAESGDPVWFDRTAP